ncbi:MAG: hypothetical protein QOG34_759 [Frankiaceae bacterium]|jgi:hypothetical protein|nr:hypothetical protein [Frankiaceae bacterium]
MIRIDARSDEGVSLIMALVFITFSGLVIGSMLTFGTSAFKFSSTAQDQRSVVYAADAAVQGAIQNARRNLDAGISGDTTNCAYAPPVVNAVSGITVTCAAQSDSGGAGAKDQFKNAILTLSTNASEGAYFTGTGSSDTYVDGAVFSHSKITVSGTTVHMKNGTVTSMLSGDDCTSTTKIVASTGSLPVVRQCNISFTDPNGADLNLTPLVADASTLNLNPAPFCNSLSKVLQFLPGKYTVPPANPTTGPCRTSTIWWFGQSGAASEYYFDFTGTAPVQWSAGVDVVAGAPATTVWNPTTALGGLLDALDLATPACDPTSTFGSQFVFGGKSQLFLPNNLIRFEICAPASTTSPPIAMYGVKTTANGYTAPAACFTAQPYTGEDSTHCAMWLMNNNSNKPDVALHGGLYAPSYALNVNIHNLNEGSAFSGGLVVRSFIADLSPSDHSSQALFATSLSGRTARHMIFTAYRDGTAVVTSEIHFDDGSNGGTPGGTLTVNSWSATP